ncbi:MAG TPA: flagellar type III secretion system pore protein FliP, partial [Steroidobacter sp.]
MKRARICVAAVLLATPALAAAAGEPALGTFGLSNTQQDQMAPYVRLLIGLSLLSFIPTAMVAMTSFTRIVVTLSFLRHALGMPETPPNAILLTLALFLTWFTMAPTLEQSHKEGIAPFLDGRIGTAQALERSLVPLRTFMAAHVRDEDLQSVGELARVPIPELRADVPLRVLAPAFMLSELRAAFVAGFIIFLPFLLIDLIVAAVLMALGMMMVPPASISLPLKIMLFVLIDGWSLLLR